MVSVEIASNCCSFMTAILGLWSLLPWAKFHSKRWTWKTRGKLSQRVQDSCKNFKITSRNEIYRPPTGRVGGKFIEAKGQNKSMEGLGWFSADDRSSKDDGKLPQVLLLNPRWVRKSKHLPVFQCFSLPKSVKSKALPRPLRKSSSPFMLASAASTSS